MLSLAGAATPWALNLGALGGAAAATATATDHKARVCVCLQGDNDHANTVVPYDAASHAAYAGMRPAFAYTRSALAPTVMVATAPLPDALEYALAPEGATSGWGGRMGDLFAAGNGSATFTCVNVAGNAVFLSGRSAVQYQVSPRGPVGRPWPRCSRRTVLCVAGWVRHPCRAGGVLPVLLDRLAGALRALLDATVELGVLPNRGLWEAGVGFV